jgi:competence protein ComEC
LWSRGFKRLDVVALTHAHQDHLGGLVAILQNFQVGQLWIGREVDSAEQRQLEALVVANGTRVIHELRGNTFDWDGLRGTFLWPQIAAEKLAPSAKNDDSLVVRVQYGERSIPLPGDAEKAAERSILAESDAQSLAADVLKIGHHGSKNSTTPEFLEAVSPGLAIISAGEENPYGHPSPTLVERLEQNSVPYLRTDTSGAIHAFTDGKTLEVTCFVPCPQMTEHINSTRESTGWSAPGSTRAQVPDHQQNSQQQ